MKSLSLLLAGLLVALTFGDAYGGWGAGGCPPVGGFAFGPQQPMQWNPRPWPAPFQQFPQQDKWYSWWQAQGDWWALYENERQIGCWSVSRQEYVPLLSLSPKEFGEPCEPPVTVPKELTRVVVGKDKKVDARPKCCCRPECGCGPDCDCLFTRNKELTQVQAQLKIEEEVAKDYGVDFNKLKKPADPQFRKGGPDGVKSVDRNTVIESLLPPGAALTDDSTKFHVLVVGADMVTAPVKSDWLTHPKLAVWRDRCHLNCYSPDHWRMQQYPELPKGGNPTIYFADPHGKKIAVWEGYQGADWLADVLQNPNRPSPQPGPNGGGAWTPNVWMVVAIALGVVLVGLFIMKWRAANKAG